MLFQQHRFEKDLKFTLMKAIQDNLDLYSNSYSDGIEKKVNDVTRGPERIIQKLNELAKMELHSRPDLLERYNKVLENPDLSGYHFDSTKLIAGKVYLFFVCAFSGKRGRKTNCIEIVKFFTECISKQFKNINSFRI